MSAVQSVGPQALPALQEQVEQIIAEAKRQGASACEVAVSLEQGLSTTVRQREVETVEFNRDQGFGITLYVGQLQRAGNQHWQSGQCLPAQRHE